MCEPHPILDAQMWNQEESGLLEEQLRRQLLAFEMPQESQKWSEQEIGLLEELLRRHGQEPMVLPSHSKDSVQVLAFEAPQESPSLPMRPQEPLRYRPALERAVAELLEEEQRQQQQQQPKVTTGSWISHALSTHRAEEMISASGFGCVNTIVKNAATRRESVVAASFSDANITIAGDAATKTVSMVAAGSGGIVTIESEAAAASASLVQHQQVATTSWVAQAELEGLALPPDLIRKSAHAARFAQMQMQMEEQVEAGSANLQDSSESLFGGVHGMVLQEGMILEGGKTQKGAMQEPLTEVPRECILPEGAWQEGQGRASMQLASAGELTGPDSLNSAVNASPPASPTTPAAAAATGAAVVAAGAAAVSTARVAAGAFPPTVFFLPTFPGFCCIPAAPGACYEMGKGHAFTAQQPPATCAPLIGLDKVPRWSKLRGVREE
ncbi:unnamed protein product [Closterium sp. NIES-64]|nr:unnamed protein product [Closterium sp. NIES-64]